MADKRIFDLGIGVVAGVFILSIFASTISYLDFLTANSEDIHSGLYNTQYQSYYSDLDTRDRIQQSTFNGSGFIVEKYQYIDTRGLGQGNLQVQGSQSTIKNFFNNDNFTKWDKGFIIRGFILALVGILASMLLLRMALGSNRV